MTTKHDRPELNPIYLMEFVRVFEEWLNSSNREVIEMGGIGEVQSLAQRIADLDPPARLEGSPNTC